MKAFKAFALYGAMLLAMIGIEVYISELALILSMVPIIMATAAINLIWIES